MKRKKRKKTSNKFSLLKNKNLLYCIVIFFVLLLIGLGVTFSYAFWNSSDKQTNTNDIDTGCLSFSFNDKDVDGNVTSISMDNAYPMSDLRGLATSPYTFTVTNTCNLTTDINVYLNKLSTSNLDASYIKYSLNDNDNLIDLGPSLVSNFVINSVDNITAIEEKVGSIDKSYLLHSIELLPNEAVTLNLRLWIDIDAPNSIMEQTFNSAVSVEAIPKE